MKYYVDVDESASPLSKKENEVLSLLAAGLSRPEMANHLHRSLATLNTHLHHIFEKLDADNDKQAIVIGMMRGILSFNKNLCLLLALVAGVNAALPGEAYAESDPWKVASEEPSQNRHRRGSRRGVTVRGGNQLQLRSPTRNVKD